MMSFHPLHIWAAMGLMSKIVTSVLLTMAVVSIAVVVERWITLWKSTRATTRFASDAAPLLDRRAFGELATLAGSHTASPLARLVGPMASKYVSGSADTQARLSPVELARREADRCTDAVSGELRRGLGVLASIGSIAPFVGLLGTVVGIITAFQGIASTGSGGLGAVSAGIAEALVETALGLVVAIPAVLLFNFLSTRIATVEGRLARSLGELVDEMENHHGRYDSGKFERSSGQAHAAA